jgi:hypothetical protein
MNEPRGTITKSDIEIISAFSSRVEEVCARHGYDYLRQEAKRVYGIARCANHTAKLEASRASRFYNEEYPHSVREEDEPIARMVGRIGEA